MNPPPNREVALFSAALELPAGQRAAYLVEACADDPALRQRLEALLRVHEEALPSTPRQLYEATGQWEKAAEWNKKLAEFDEAEAAEKTAAPRP